MPPTSAHRRPPPPPPPPPGVFYVKAGADAQRLFTEWLALEGGHGQDQEGFNNVMRGKATGSQKFQHVPWCKVPADTPRMLVCMNETIRTGTLSVGVFMHSYSHFVTRLHKVGDGVVWWCLARGGVCGGVRGWLLQVRHCRPLRLGSPAPWRRASPTHAPPLHTATRQVMGVRPFEVHFVWGGKGKEGKRQRMREALVYHDRPAYYGDGGFLSVELDYLQVGRVVGCGVVVVCGWVGGGWGWGWGLGRVGLDGGL
jgi:hypothetical protein